MGWFGLGSEYSQFQKRSTLDRSVEALDCFVVVKINIIKIGIVQHGLSLNVDGSPVIENDSVNRHKGRAS